MWGKSSKPVTKSPIPSTQGFPTFSVPLAAARAVGRGRRATRTVSKSPIKRQEAAKA